MLRTTMDQLTIERTLRPLYAQHQATPYGGFLDAGWVKSTADIYPGMVCVKLAGENFTLYTGASGQKPWGLSALFVAPLLGIDEVANSGTNVFTVWLGNQQSVFEVLSPAFDSTASWTNPTDGSRVPLFATKTAHAQGPGKLTIGTGSDKGTDKIGELIQVVGTKKLIVSLDRVP